MTIPPAQPDPARFFTIDPLHGVLLDRNGDGVPDDLRVRLVVAGFPATEEWIELIHLAARLGLETSALTLPLALPADATLPTDTRALLFLPAGGADPAPAADAWVVRGAAALRALWRAGLADAATPDNAPPTRRPSDTPLDLARFYETDGALADDDGDLFPERVRLCPFIPPTLPPVVGLALVDLAARLGLEAVGLCFPLALPEGVPPPPATIPLYLRIATGTSPGLGHCTVTAEGDDGGPALLVTGDAAGAAAILRELAATWPHLRPGDTDGPTATDLADELAATLHAENGAGRAALLVADLAALADAAPAGELRLLSDDPALLVAARAIIARDDMPLTPIVAPDDRFAFVDEWADEWEVDRARRIVRERVLPTLDPAAPAEVLLLVSESGPIRQSLATELAALAWPHGSEVRVLSAFKPGLCWLREVVTPRWAARGDIADVELRYRPFVAPEGQPFLDLPIRNLQELHPGDELLAAALGLPLDAVALIEDATLAETYRAVARDSDGREVDALTFSPRRYTHPYLQGFPTEGLVTVTTGAIVVRQGGRTIVDLPLSTDLDRLWAHYQEVVLPRVRALIVAETGGVITAAAQPFFDALDIDVWCSEEDEALGLREELLSAAEALHQDLYFGTLDALAALGIDQPASGTLDGGKGGGELDAPGAVRPFIHVRPGTGPRARIALRRRLRHLADFVPTGPDTRTPLGYLPTVQRPHVTVRAITARADIPGIAALDLTVTGGDPRLPALAHALVSAPPPGATLAATLHLPGATIALALALPPLPPPVALRPSTFDPVLDQAPTVALDADDLQPLLAQLATLPGVTIRRVARSFEGRPLDAIEVVAPGGGALRSRRKLGLFKPTLLVVARHHANEPASTPAALQLAELCATDPAYRPLLDRVNLVLLPLENPDGAALHGAMRREHPTWKLHAARYNAVGREFARDFWADEGATGATVPWGEARARPRLWREWLPDVVVDNHGVPSHEWNQHFNGFGSPPRFGVSYWLVSALLYGILRYPTDDPAHAAFAEAARDRIALAVAADPAIVAADRILRDRYQRWGYSRLPERFPATYHRDMLWYFGPQTPEARARASRPAAYDRITVADIVTEVPDETAQGDYLTLVAHAHLVANVALLRLLADAAPPIERRVRADNDTLSLTLWRKRPLHQA